jgi:preprotein translocase subunit SecG
MKKLLAYLAPLSVLAVPVTFVHAQWSGTFGEWEGFLGGLQGFLNILVVVIVALAVIFFLWGLMLFILSAGDEEKRSKGKSIMVWGIIALVVMVAVWGIVNLLATIFGEGDPLTPRLP